MARRQPATGVMFDRQKYEQLIRARRELNQMIGDIDKAEACGVQCAVLRQQRDDLDKQLEAIQLHFMTPAPTN